MRRPSRIFGLALAVCMLPPLASAAPPATSPGQQPHLSSFSDPGMQRRYDELLRQLRCMVCQNQSLADSGADLAADLRADVYDMVAAGHDKDHIVAALSSRYGDYISYKPPLRRSTLLLWLAPPAMLLLALLVAWRALRAPASGQAEPQGKC